MPGLCGVWGGVGWRGVVWYVYLCTNVCTYVHLMCMYIIIIPCCTQDAHVLQYNFHYSTHTYSVHMYKGFCGMQQIYVDLLYIVTGMRKLCVCKDSHLSILQWVRISALLVECTQRRWRPIECGSANLLPTSCEYPYRSAECGPIWLTVWMIITLQDLHCS